MKLKYFLRGLGTGIIFAALILTISYRVSNKNEMTDGQLIKKAKELGMVMETDELKDSLENLKSPEPKENEDNLVSSSESPTPSATPKETKVPKKSEEPKKPKESKEPEKSEEKEEVQERTKFTIQSGMSSAQISSYFESIGLVDSAEKFDKYLCDNGYSSRISVGSFEILANPSYDEIITIITK